MRNRIRAPRTGILIGAFLLSTWLAGPVECFGQAAPESAKEQGGSDTTAYWSKWTEASLWFGTSAPGNLFYPGEEASATLIAPPYPAGQDIRVSGKVVSARGDLVAELPAIVLTKQGNYRSTTKLPTNGIGFYRLLLTATDGTVSKSIVRRYAVIPTHPESKEPESPFGVNTHFNPFKSKKPPAVLGKIVKRTGIAWIRDGVQTANLSEDQAVVVAEENNLCYLPVFSATYMPIEDHRTSDSGWDFSRVAEKHRAYAEKYGKYIEYYDLANEPMQKWSKAVGGSWWGGPWVRPFAMYGAAVTKAIKEADPDAKMIWEDGDTLVWYPQFFDQAKESIDLISPHPYNTHPALPLPEEQPTLAQYDELHSFIKDRNLSWKVWVGEIGYSSFILPEGKKPTFYTPATEEEQASLLVRAMVMHLYHGADKVFWYGLKDNGTDPGESEHNFGLFTYDLQPKPAAVAYSALIARVRSSTWIGSYRIGGSARGYVFEDSASGKPTLIAWHQNAARSEAIPVQAADGSKVTVTDIYGLTSELVVQDGKVKIPLSTSPVYVDGLGHADVDPYIGRKRSWKDSNTRP